MSVAGRLEAMATASQLADAEAYRGMLVAANLQMNLVGPSTLEDFWVRHFLDSAQLASLAPGARSWADLGTGAGLPGLILGILLKGNVNAQVHLVESQAKKCRFLSEVAQALDLPVKVHNARAESLRLTVDVVTARACAPLKKLLGYADPYFRRGALGLFLKGEGVDLEIADARSAWQFKSEVTPSASDERGRVLWISELRHV